MKYLVLFVPCLISLWVPFYNTVDPTLAGIPFFYWFLLAMIPVSSAFIWVASLMEGDKS